MGVSNEVKEQLDRSLVAYEFLIKKELKSKSNMSFDVEIKNKTISYYKTEGNFALYFELSYQTEDVDFIEDVVEVLKLIDDVTFDVFNKFQINKSGALVKRTREVGEYDDTCCYLNVVNLGSDKILTVLIGQEFNAYE